MKVILTEDVEKLGHIHDVVEVADGYARNYLLPRRLAMLADKSAMANLDNLKRVEDRRQVRLRGSSEELARKLEGARVVIAANTGAEGRLYGSVGAADIARQLQQDFGVEVDRKQVALPEPIRLAGLYTIPLNLHRDVKQHITVQVGEGNFAQPATGTTADTVPDASTAEAAASPS